MIKVIAIVGPTAVGKTKLSIEMAKKINGEIISGDSMQVYRRLDIGTAKVTPSEMNGVVHHLINIKDVCDRFSVAEFKKMATKLIYRIHADGKIPIIVGGTGFYLQSLTDNLTLGDDNFDEQSVAIREKWQVYLQNNDAQHLWRELEIRDAAAANQIEVNNTRRIIRALEVIENTGKLFSSQEQLESEFDIKLIGLNTERSVLYQRINQRVDTMIEQGLEKEARWLFDEGGYDIPTAKGIGYHELFEYFTGKSTMEHAIEEIKKDSRHYAKRQLTWFRNKMDVEWYDLVSGKNTIEQVNNDVLNWLK